MVSRWSQGEAGPQRRDYEITAEGAEGKTAVFHVIAEGFNHALEHPRAKADSSFCVAADRLPAGLKRFSVRPLDCWWKKGAPLSVDV